MRTVRRYSGALAGYHAIKLLGHPRDYSRRVCLSFNVFHSVPNAGYGSTDKGEKYWIVQNSWGTSWGVKGTFMIRRGTNECGIEVQIAPTHVMLPFLLTPPRSARRS
jgi:hypothetical protein